ncbi:MAG: ditA2 [Rhizorhabdus sp.]|nr:ditA2 [Rhizorhabdus sp.]
MRPNGAPGPANDPTVSLSLFERGPALNSAIDPICGEIINFLVREAEMLDEDFHEEWLDLLAEDLVYRLPARNTLSRADGRGYDPSHNLFDDDKASMRMRVKRSVGIAAAYDRDPPPRTRRMVTNIAVHVTDTPDEFFVTSYILLLRSRFDDVTMDILSGRREDVLRRTDAGFMLARRTILPDQSQFGATFLNVFL